MTSYKPTLIQLTIGNLKFATLKIFLVLFTNAIACLSHEYSYPFLTWILGFRQNPLALDYVSPTSHNIILSGDIGKNVNYKQIIDSRNGVRGGIIALAGAGIGNALPYFRCYLLTKLKRIRSSRGAAAFLFWLY